MRTLFALILLLNVSPSIANDEDHGRPVGKVAAELGVTPEKFRECFKKVRPAHKGQRPDPEQRKANHEVLTQCLGVDGDKLNSVMDKYRPEGPRH